MKRYRPCYIDRGASPCYVHVETRVEADGRVIAVFADGHESHSVYATEAELLTAARQDWRERVYLVQA